METLLALEMVRVTEAAAIASARQRPDPRPCDRPAHETSGCDGRGLCHAHHLQREQRFHRVRPASLVPVVAAARKDHCHVMPVGDLDRHLVTHGAAGLDDRGDATLGGKLNGIGEWEVGI